MGSSPQKHALYRNVYANQGKWLLRFGSPLLFKKMEIQPGNPNLEVLESLTLAHKPPAVQRSSYHQQQRHTNQK